jgi:hypothetical protein
MGSRIKEAVRAFLSLGETVGDDAWGSCASDLSAVLLEASPSNVGSVCGPSTKARVVDSLRWCIVSSSRGSAARRGAMSVIRVILREVEGSEPLRDEESIMAYLSAAQAATEAADAARAVASLQCLLNSLLQNALGVTMFVRKAGIEEVFALSRQEQAASSLYLVFRLIYSICATNQGALAALEAMGATAVDQLLGTLQWSSFCTTPAEFPRGRGRVPMNCEILKILFLLGSRGCGAGMAAVASDCLLLAHSEMPAFGQKIKAVHVLMNVSDDELMEAITRDHGVRLVHLLQVLDIQMRRADDDKSMDLQSELAPLLAVLSRIAEYEKDEGKWRSWLKGAIFPPSGDAAVNEIMKEPVLSSGGSKRMHPIDAPAFSRCACLISLMTSINSTTKRFASEFLRALCDSDDEFVVRVGFGNAVALLRQRGLLGGYSKK